MEKVLDQIPWAAVVLLCMTIGLAPFNPPHVWEKMQMLLRGELRRPLDWFDFAMHGAPWLLLLAKSAALWW